MLSTHKLLPNFFVFVALIFFVLRVDLFCQTQTQYLKPPETLIVEGVPNIPKALESDLLTFSQYKSSNFIGWKKDGTLIGYTEYYRPFFLKPGGNERQSFDFSIPDPTTFLLQPGAEKSFLFTKDNNGDEYTQLFKYDFDLKNRFACRSTTKCPCRLRRTSPAYKMPRL